MAKNHKVRKLAKNRYDLDPERLASTDEFGNRVYIYPEDVKGKWKSRRTKVYWGLIFVYLILPWIYINEKPALMLNLAKREFTFLGSTLHGLEPILIFLMFISGLFFIAFITSVYGRIWCGWACPQTVFIQSIFLKIEALIEGRASQRIKLDQSKLSLEKVLKRSLKWFIYTVISLHISHTFIGYFVGPRELFAITMNAPSENLGIFIATMICTAIILLDFGWFREQFCIIACPYGRIQSVMMDSSSKVVAYDYNRGEPRTGSDSYTKESGGDCINCYHCVKVCPTGIDIRRGTQLECIACTQCIDACDAIMERVKKPSGLIRYTNEIELQNIEAKKNWRPYIYLLFLTGFLFAFFYFLDSSTKPNLVFLRGRGAPFLSSVVDGQHLITNKFTLKIKHQGTEVFPINLKILDKAAITLTLSQSPILLDEPEKKVFAFFKFDQSILINGTKKILIEVIDARTAQSISQREVTLVGPMD